MCVYLKNRCAVVVSGEVGPVGTMCLLEERVGGTGKCGVLWCGGVPWEPCVY